EAIQDNVLHSSRVTSILLIIAYLIYIWFQMRTQQCIFGAILERDEEKDADKARDAAKSKLTLTECVIALVVSMTLVTLVAISLVEQIGYIIEERGITEAFMGLILVPLVESPVSVIGNGTIRLESCCNKKEKKHRERKANRAQPLPTFKPSGYKGMSKDPEKGSVGELETVNFLVSGMDCTSCVDKLMRLFDSMEGISEASVNFVMGNGRFVIDTALTNADEAIRFAASSSGFSMSLVVGGDYFLDILAPAAEGKRLTDFSTPGLLNVETLDKKTQRVYYDPVIIGARDLLSYVDERYRNLAQPRADPQLRNSQLRLWDQLFKSCLAIALTVPVAVVSWSGNLVEKKTEDIIGLVLGTLVQIIAIPEFYRPAITALWYSRVVEMDMLVVMSITAAYVYSLVAFSFEMADKPLDEGQFFETSTMLITLILLGRLIAAFARVQAVSAVSLRSRQNNVASLVTPDKDREIDARLLQYGDQFRVSPHSRVPTDGVILQGETEVDESMLTGESLPVFKRAGDTMIAGTVSGDGTVIVQLTRLPGKNTVTDIAQLVEDASNSKPKLQDIANKVAGWFVPVMAVVAVLVLVIWLGCVVAGGIAARGGVIIKSADITDGARKTTDVVFDKTGTITEDGLAVIEQVLLNGDEAEAIAITKALVNGGKHPVSAAVDKHIQQQDVKPLPDVANIRVVPGAGIEAQYKDSTLKAGNVRWTKTSTLKETIRLQSDGLTTLVVARNEVPIIIFGLSTQIRPEATRVVADLKARNITVHLVSGDQLIAVKATATAVGILPENVAGERNPTEKRDYIATLMQDSTKKVMFCGDGTNDAVAVAQADIGAHMGGGLTASDVTQGAADVVLMKGLEGIPFLLEVSKASYNRMYFNFVWSAIYNVLAVTMASGAWIKFRIPPRYAGLGEMVSVVPVILAALSLLFLNFGNKKQPKAA
ncbi:hypothetical protein E8E11_000021, partial [Didymella keratinophila]